MKAINIYALTRIAEASRLERMEKQMSGRSRALRIKSWETDGLRAFMEHLQEVMENAPSLKFFYSFTMPKLGKEFDLLRVNEEYAVNVELKSGGVTDDMIQKQLVQNRYYLATLGKSMYFYTYVSREDRLLRLSNSGRLVRAEWEELAGLLEKQRSCYEGHIEDLFKEDSYLISPLTDPGRFLRQEYFLTFQQRDIKKQILKQIRRQPGFSLQGYTGLPGTGKTILLYDIAMELSKSNKVCVLHFGSHEKELEQLDERLKRIDFFYALPQEGHYSAILVDEGHRLEEGVLQLIVSAAREKDIPLLFSYDREDALAPEERGRCGADLIEELPGFVKYKLTNRIRLNSELSTFIKTVMCLAAPGRDRAFPSVSLVYAADEQEKELLIGIFQEEGYTYIWDAALEGERRSQDAGQIEASAASCREFEKVVMLLDESFCYDERGYLRHVPGQAAEDGRVRSLFHGLNRAKKKIALVVCKNEAIFDELLSVLQK